ncbi:CesT family type III secretion system chaperone [Salmonella enterica]|uniref:Tir chaperone n=1 Tax=Salmonella diarizonae TaxID=59204 RepID=A0A379U2W4_SALDZ|nr:CesT family type III secretion system chaperone [Salmonella enterica]EBP3743336.1 CesT family type III secretion system chaperone [Salmonella enterica subsp. arizonae]EDR1379010.1 CesT family type III secretion system chaperone [Salmonella enterica subsp. diarizonae serovar 61:r:z53]EDW1845266.1 CesT family type III secretion system chaperone [Salmonella enterica subsp. enterica]EHG9035193.1 CesT family type III secretion system chaperone [Salmonella enterica subsp. diarizonae serovar 53:z10
MSLRANIILKEFGITQGVPDMKFNEDGICSFLIDEEYDITLIADSDEKIYMYGVLANTTIEDAHKQALVLISANTYLFSSAELVCCYESQAQAFILMKVLNLDNLTTNIIEESIDKIIDTIKNVRSTLVELEL